VLCLASPEAAFITGTDLLIGGGATAGHVNGPGYARGSTPAGAGDLETAVGGVSPAPSDGGVGEMSQVGVVAGL